MRSVNVQPVSQDTPTDWLLQNFYLKEGNAFEFDKLEKYSSRAAYPSRTWASAASAAERAPEFISCSTTSRNHLHRVIRSVYEWIQASFRPSLIEPEIRFTIHLSAAERPLDSFHLVSTFWPPRFRAEHPWKADHGDILLDDLQITWIRLLG